MTTPPCPKCRQPVTDAALDAGQCPLCGFPFDRPVLLDGPSSRLGAVAVAFAVVLAAIGSGFGGYYYSINNRTQPKPEPEFVAAPRAAPKPARPQPATRPIAPLPHEPKQNDVPTPAPNPITVEPPKKDGPRPIAVVMKVDPKIAPKRHFDQPDDTIALPDLNSGDRIVLTGKIRVLRLGSVNGNASVDASGLIAEEVIITGDLNGEALVRLNAPGGKVKIGGYVMGAAKLTVVAPGGEVLVAGNSGCLTGGALATVTAKRVVVAGWMSGGAKLNITLTTGGVLKLTRLQEGAIVTYRKAAVSDPALAVERGQLKGGAKVIAR